VSHSEHKYLAQADRVLALLKSGQSVNQFDAIDALGILRLASRINELRERGYVIDTKMVDVHNRFRERCRVASYSLAQSPDETKVTS